MEAITALDLIEQGLLLLSQLVISYFGIGRTLNQHQVVIAAALDQDGSFGACDGHTSWNNDSCGATVGHVLARKGCSSTGNDTPLTLSGTPPDSIKVKLGCPMVSTSIEVHLVSLLE